MSNRKISIIIPAYNEEKNIKATLKCIEHEFKGKFFNYEIIVVDDGSTDKTSKLVEEIKTPNIKLIKLDKNKGKGKAVKTGLMKAEGALCLYTDADNSTPITHLFDFLPYLQEYDIIIGSRSLPKSKITKRQPFYKEFLGKGGNLLIKKFLKLNYKDTQCGFKLLKKNVVKKVIPQLQCPRWGFDFELLKASEIEGFKIKELPITWRNNSKSAVSFFDYFKTLKNLLEVRKKYDRKIQNKES